MSLVRPEPPEEPPVSPRDHLRRSVRYLQRSLAAIADIPLERQESHKLPRIPVGPNHVLEGTESDSMSQITGGAGAQGGSSSRSGRFQGKGKKVSLIVPWDSAEQGTLRKTPGVTPERGLARMVSPDNWTAPPMNDIPLSTSGHSTTNQGPQGQGTHAGTTGMQAHKLTVTGPAQNHHLASRIWAGQFQDATGSHHRTSSSSTAEPDPNVPPPLYWGGASRLRLSGIFQSH